MPFSLMESGHVGSCCLVVPMVLTCLCQRVQLLNLSGLFLLYLYLYINSNFFYICMLLLIVPMVLTYLCQRVHLLNLSGIIPLSKGLPAVFIIPLYPWIVHIIIGKTHNSMIFSVVHNTESTIALTSDHHSQCLRGSI